MDRRRIAARPPAPRRTGLTRRSGADRSRSRAWSPVRPRARRDPPRRQAGEHPADPGRQHHGGGLRHRPTGPDRRHRASHRHRRGDRHAGVHEPGTGRGWRSGRPHGRVRPRLRALRDADRRPSVRRRHGSGGRGPTPDRAAAALGHQGRGDPSEAPDRVGTSTGQVAQGSPGERRTLRRITRRGGREGSDGESAPHGHRWRDSRARRAWRPSSRFAARPASRPQPRRRARSRRDSRAG